ncbi:MAG: Uncharacterized protein Athens101410_491 [Parcubacteria group bacterium Athens1014_10]|nr:MAG: Uncharacterized protein Athens101410_491 [Parcubacteria group bacterium Athens1014_10]TSD04885.1 MAG: Uncharacterized protein Athens071412_566 [Parcubacteria group bacterium Athens0714_12]
MKDNQNKEKSPYIVDLKKRFKSPEKNIGVDSDINIKRKKISFKSLAVFISVCFILISFFYSLSYIDKFSFYPGKIYQSIVKITKLKDFIPLIKFYKKILANPNSQRYLILFQNNNEMRGTGGFLGSFAIVEFEDKKIKRLEIPGQGPYGFRNLFSQKTGKWLKPPAPFLMINNHWEMQDMNWWPDFASSAQKVAWFYQRATEEESDGVIAFDTVFIEELLKITGVLEIPEYNKTISAENFLWETQETVESKEARASGEPKKFIADLAPLLLNKISSFSKKDYINLLFLIDKMRKEKHFMIYFKDNDLEKEILKLGFGGEIKDTQKDYLMVVNTNINGGKTDGMIKQTINHQAEVLADGSVISQVEITREHQGDPENKFTRMTNNSYIRVYVPIDSKLLSVEGFDAPDKEKFLISEPICEEDDDLKRISGEIKMDESTNTSINNELNKTVFGNWMILKLGERNTLKLRYLLPFKLEKSYSLLIQKQAGVKDGRIISEIVLPESYDVAWQYPKNLTKKARTIEFYDDLSEDKYWGVVFK